MLFAEPTPVLPLLRDGRVRPLGVSAGPRLPTLSAIPTVAEAGVAGFNFVSWQMMVAPAGTPKEILERLHAEIKASWRCPRSARSSPRPAASRSAILPLDELSAL